QVTHVLRGGELRQISRAAGHRVVDKQGLRVGAVRARILDHLHLEVVRGSSESRTQREEQGRFQGGYGFRLPHGQCRGQPNGNAFSIQGAAEGNWYGVVVDLGAVRAPGTVVAGGVGTGVVVDLAAG